MATAKQIEYLRSLLDEANEEEYYYVNDLTRGVKSELSELTVAEASAAIDDLKMLLGWDS